MAKQIAAQVGAWVKPIETVGMLDDGDPTAVLRRVYQRFSLKAVEMYEKESGKNAKRIRVAGEYYEQAAIDIQRLIDQGASEPSIEDPMNLRGETLQGTQYVGGADESSVAGQIGRE